MKEGFIKINRNNNEQNNEYNEKLRYVFFFFF